MTAYAETRSVAHVMVWHEDGWRSLCRNHVRLFAAWDGPWPIVSFIHYATEQPSRSWCADCRKQVSLMARDLRLIPRASGG